ncbi:MAG: hypothetical protein KGL48_13880 [Sphingomonadales bacterium]|nr:hypothetical protein [Sphingomonadales bacterium]
MVAYVDGRLDSQARADFEARLANDPVLAARVAAHGWMSRQIVAAFGVPPGDEVDKADLALLGLSSGNVVELARPSSRAIRRPVLAAILSGSLAASLVAGVFLDRTLREPDAGMLLADGNGEVLAKGELAESLSNHFSGAPGEVRIGLSFRTARTVCRTFSTTHGLSGLGCRDGRRWVVPMIAAVHDDEQGQAEYRLAGGDVAPVVMAEVDKRMVGAPLSPGDEKALMASGWHAGR